MDSLMAKPDTWTWVKAVYLGGDPANHGGSGEVRQGSEGKEVHIESVHELGTWGSIPLG